MKYNKRIIDSIINQRLEATGAIVVEGPKWCGKTTSSIQAAGSVLKMDDPDKSKQYVRYADINASKLLQGDTPRLIDEWQIAPKLWDAVRVEVDRRSLPGQFILTGSSTPPDTTSIFHSGAGRFSWVKMNTMSLYESHDSTGEVSLKNLFSGSETIDGFKETSIEDLAYLICRGGWPFSIGLSKTAALKQAPAYYDTVIRTEINTFSQRERNKDRVALLMRSLSRNQCSSCSINTIQEDMKKHDMGNLSENTLVSYLKTLADIYVTEDMSAWNPNLRSKVAIRTSSTRYFTDPSIACAALGLGPSDLINDLNTFGLLFEALCIRDLRVYAYANDGNVYQYRDKSGLECDCVIHLRNGKYCLVEVKLGGDKLIDEGARNLKSLCAKIDTSKMKEPAFMMVVVGVGDFPYRRKDGVYVVPICCLKD